MEEEGPGQRGGAAKPPLLHLPDRRLSRHQFLRAAGVGGVLLLLPSWARAAVLPPPAKPRRDSVVVRWNEAALQAVRDSKLGPPMVSRALAILHTCAYDAWAAYDRDAVGTRLGGVLRRPPAERTRSNKEQAISFAAYRAAVDLFPASGAVATPGFVGAQWQHVTPFALTSSGMLRSANGPARYGSQPYLSEAEKLLALSAGLTDEQKVIAEYWADGPHSELPPGHWNLFAQQVVDRDRTGSSEHDLDRAVKLFFALTNAIFDAGCCAWDSKIAFDSVRPVTAIRWLFRG